MPQMTDIMDIYAIVRYNLRQQIDTSCDMEVKNMQRELPVRKKNRLEGYDYARMGKYFVTMCVEDRANLLWEDLSEHGEYWELSKHGKIVEKEIQHLGCIYSNVHLDQYCIMPEHIHMIISIEMQTCRGELCSPDVSPSLSRIVKQFKGSVTKQLGFSIWQKTYYDRIIRNEEEYERVKKYISDNPLNRLSGKSSGNDLTFLD